MKESMLSLEEQHNLGLPTFKLSASTKNHFKTNTLNKKMTISVYVY